LEIYDIIFWGPKHAQKYSVDTLSARCLTSVWKVFLPDLLHGVVGVIRVFNKRIRTAHEIMSPIIIRAKSLSQGNYHKGSALYTALQAMLFVFAKRASWMPTVGF
jgi:hypothetical protein